MKLEDILKIVDTNPKEAIKQLKGVFKPVDVEPIKKQIDPMLHKVMDYTHRQDRNIMNADGSLKSVDRVGRTPLSLQAIIVSRAVSFLFGFDPKIKGEAKTPNQVALLDSVKKVLNIAKSNTLNADVATDLFSCTQVAELWYPSKLKEKTDFYGFKSDTKLRTMIFSPLRGDKLYPFFDEFGDMVAFSREYITETVEGQTTYLETYTAEQILKFNLTDGGESPIISKNIIGKIPIVYASQENVEWYKVQKCIERLEDLLSNFSDTNDKNGSPILFIEGGLKAMPEKEQTGKILVGDAGSKAQYITWSHAPESIKLEINTLFEVIYGFTQTPNISFESVKSIGQISGISLKLLFMDAHMKVQSKRRIFDNYLIRRINIIKSWLAVVNPEYKKEVNMYIEAEIVPYMISDLKEMIDNMNTATGGQSVVSQETAVNVLGLVDNVESEIEKIKNDAKEIASLDVFAPVK